MFRRLFGKPPERVAAERIYGAIVQQARSAAFFEGDGAPDTVEGRFELLTIHMHLTLRRLKAEADGDPRLAQTLFDVFFQNMDDSLRELGVGDLSVGKKIRKMAEAFYGRVGAYEQALDAGAEGRASLVDALSRNVFGEDAAPAAAPLADYAIAADAALKDQAAAAIADGAITFPPAPRLAGANAA